MLLLVPLIVQAWPRVKRAANADSPCIAMAAAATDGTPEMPEIEVRVEEPRVKVPEAEAEALLSASVALTGDPG